MRKLLAFLTMAGLLSFGIGCGGPATTGGTKSGTKPGTTPTTPKKTTTDGDKGKITLDAPPATVTKGKEAKIMIKIKRDDVSGAVMLTYDAPEGLTVEGGDTIPAGKDETEVTIKAAKDAKGGKIKVTATAGTVKATGTIDVTVK